jgi:hypothetical protein
MTLAQAEQLTERTWNVELDGFRHVVEIPKQSALTGPRKYVLVDAKRVDLADTRAGGVRVGGTAIGGHRLEVARVTQRLSARQRLRSAFTLKNFGRALAADLVAGPGAAAGLQAGAEYNQTRVAYVLAIDGVAQGAWVYWFRSMSSQWLFEPVLTNPFRS